MPTPLPSSRPLPLTETDLPSSPTHTHRLARRESELRTACSTAHALQQLKFELSHGLESARRERDEMDRQLQDKSRELSDSQERASVLAGERDELSRKCQDLEIERKVLLERLRLEEERSSIAANNTNSNNNVEQQTPNSTIGSNRGANISSEELQALRAQLSQAEEETGRLRKMLQEEKAAYEDRLRTAHTQERELEKELEAVRARATEEEEERCVV